MKVLHVLSNGSLYFYYCNNNNKIIFFSKDYINLPLYKKETKTKLKSLSNSIYKKKYLNVINM